jgi:hypothetical protein
MNALLLVRFASGRSDAVRNMTYIESIGAETHKRVLSNRDELARLVERVFSIPYRIVIEALSEIKQMEDAWN